MPPPSFASQLPKIHVQRLLTWNACQNVRDLGGLPLKDGGSTRWRAVARADDLCQLTVEGQLALIDHGIRTIIDLRAHFEIPHRLHPYRPPYAGSASYLHLPPTGNDTVPLAAIATAPSLKDTYVRALQLRRPQYGAILTAIAQAPEGGEVVHCVSGKDRTGLVVALLLALLGVPDAVIAEDYALSGLHLQDRQFDGTDGVPADSGVRTRLTVERLSPPEAILTALTFVREQYGSIEEYLGGAGVAEADMELLQARMK